MLCLLKILIEDAYLVELEPKKYKLYSNGLVQNNAVFELKHLFVPSLLGQRR